MLFEQLIPKLMKSVADSSGAERGYLLLGLNGKPVEVVSAYNVIEVENNKLLQKLHEDPISLLEQLQPLIEEVKDVNPEVSWRIAIPVPKAGKLMGYFYVENPLTKNNFDENQHEILSTLASQAAISLENSQLLADLEIKTDELTSERNRVADINQMIEEKNRDITDSIRYAQRIQNSILPPTALLNQFVPDSFVFHRAKDIVSGDFYWWHNDSDFLIIAAVDCTGHGVPGAFMSVIGSNYLNQIVADRGMRQPGSILNALNEQVRKSLKQDSDEATTRDGMDLALCVIDRNEKKITFGGAYRPLYVVRNGEIIEYAPNKFSIAGVQFENIDMNFTTQEVDIEFGDVLYLGSDGYADQFGGPKTKKMSTRRFKQLLTQIYQHPMHIQMELLQHNFDKWKADEEQTDDILLIGLRITEECFFVHENEFNTYVST